MNNIVLFLFKLSHPKKFFFESRQIGTAAILAKFANSHKFFEKTKGSAADNLMPYLNPKLQNRHVSLFQSICDIDRCCLHILRIELVTENWKEELFCPKRH